MLDPYRLAISVTHADGRVTRWGPDELDARDIAKSIGWRTAIPGGFKDFTCSLLRPGQRTYQDQALFDNVRCYGPGNETGFDGRAAMFPRSEDGRVQPAAIGWASHLEDNRAFREIYVDRDLTRWGSASVSRRLAAAAGSPTYGVRDAQAVPDPATGLPALMCQLNDAWSVRPFVEAVYDSGGVPIGSLYYAWKKNAAIALPDANWFWQAFVLDDAEFSSYDQTANLAGAGPGTGTLDATTGTRRFAAVELLYNNAPAGGSDNCVFWTCLAVYGNHGLTKRGLAGATNAQGFYGADVIADVVARAAPLLRFTTGEGGSIEPSSFVIPHLVFASAPVTGADAVSLVNGYHLNEWGVYDDREFFWRSPDPDRLTWRAKLTNGARLGLEGDDANNLFNGIFVTYQDPSGRAATVGPPGTYADANSALLVDTDPENPVNQHGLTRIAHLEVGQVTTLAGAIKVGEVWLAEHRLPTRRGQLNLTGMVEHPTKGMRPVWAVRAGDYVDIIERPDEPPRRIIETAYAHDERQLQSSLDNTVFNLDALFERIGIGLIGVL